MDSSHVHKLSSDLGVYYHGGVILYDIVGNITTPLAELDDDQMVKLVAWYTDGLCPVCAKAVINTGEIICNGCFAEAERFQPAAQRGRIDATHRGDDTDLPP